MPAIHRPLADDDVEIIATIHREACLTAYAFMGWNYSWQECRDWYEGKLPDWDWGLVALMDGEAAGFAAGMGTHLDQLFVHPLHQHKGIGSGLLRAALARTPPIEPLNVFAENAGARRLYERFGFREAGTVPGGEGVTLELLYRRGPS